MTNRKELKTYEELAAYLDAIKKPNTSRCLSIALELMMVAV